MSIREFQIIPVLDVKRGEAVHAVGGVRAHYQPVQGILNASSDPLELARAYLDALGFRDLYVADLDSISGARFSPAIYREMAVLADNLWIDAGVKTVKDLDPLLETENMTIVLGLETVRGPQALSEILHRTYGCRVVFSLDMFAGVPRMSKDALWPTADPYRLCCHAIRLGVRRLLLLDLSRVGIGEGTGTDELRTALLVDHPEVDVFVGGGISGMEEILRLRSEGVAGVLIGSALHDGRIGRHELDRLRDDCTPSGPARG
jgi:phosphoribosylformimino-5-aminoimidazole carboxamide ribotide isomerase